MRSDGVSRRTAKVRGVARFLLILLVAAAPLPAQRLTEPHPAALTPRDAVRPAAAPVSTTPRPPARDTAAVPPRNRRVAHAKRGALIGAALGVGAALFVSFGLQEPWGEDFLSARETWEAAGVLGGVGALAGALLGALIP